MKIYILTVTLLAAFASACAVNMGTPVNNGVPNTTRANNTATASATTEKSKDSTQKPETSTEKTKDEAPTDKSKAERIQLPKGEQIADVSGTLGGGQSKKYVAYVIKGNMICVVPSGDLDSNIRVKLDGNEFDFRDTTCGDHQKDTKDHTIEIYNNGNKNSAFSFSISFQEHG